MVLCDNVFCSGEAVEFEYITLAGRRFCCVACADAWHQQNEVLAEAATPLREILEFARGTRRKKLLGRPAQRAGLGLVRGKRRAASKALRRRAGLCLAEAAPDY